MADEVEQTPEKKITPYNSLPGNSKKSRSVEGKDKITPIVQGQVIQRKPSLGKRILETFTGDDTRTVGDYVLFEVIIPTVRDLFVETIISSAQRFFYGGGASSSNVGGGPRRGYTNYRTVSSTPATARPGYSQPNARANHNFDDIILESRRAAEEVIDALNELINAYDVASVSDFYELVGVTGSYQDDNWGWNTLVGARVDIIRLDRGQTGYVIRLPKTIPLNK